MREMRNGIVQMCCLLRMRRHWQELGYLLLYVTARPDMQQKKVLAWLAQHNFPHGMVGFMDGLSADPIRQKLHYIRQIVQEVRTLHPADRAGGV